MGGRLAKAELRNDLQAPIEIKCADGSWRVLYPGREMDLAGWDGEVEARLREPPQLACCVPAGALRASRDLKEVTREGQRRDAQEVREAAEVRWRREEAKRRLKAAAHELALEPGTARNWFFWRRQLPFLCFLFILPLSGLAAVALVPPRSALAVGLLAGLGALPLGTWLSAWVAAIILGKGLNEYVFGRRAACFAVVWRLLGLLSLLFLVWMTVRHCLAGFWWTALLIWAGPCCCNTSLACWARKAGENRRWAEIRKEAEAAVLERSIVFKGAVIPEPGRKCICSWPGKYEGAWDRMVSAAKDGDVSAAVVFLPDGTAEFGEHSDIPESEPFEGQCWCLPLYGERKPWGCRWFELWIANVQQAAEAGAELEVYFFANMVGMGKVKDFATAGADNLRREQVNATKRVFFCSEGFRAALDAGLSGLSRQARADSSSPCDREVHRLFLEWLTDQDREFLEGSEGLGNSQKAEVAWLEYKKYPYVQRDVADWLAGEAEADVALQVQSWTHKPTMPSPRAYGKAQRSVAPV